MRIGITGCGGRMGQMVLHTVLTTEGVSVSGGVERADHAALGRDLGALVGAAPLGLALANDAEALFAGSDAVIDFTTPEATAAHAKLAAHHGAALICGTTGLAAAEREALAAAARAVPVVYAANMSVGVNLLIGLTRRVATLLGQDYDIEIVEMHHRMKVDAPSGTALMLGEAAARGRQVALADVAQRVRDGVTGPRPTGEIGFSVIRGGGIIGEHSVIFAAEDEILTLSHSARDRGLFARGAVEAARWVIGQPPGLYDMQDVLGLK